MKNAVLISLLCVCVWMACKKKPDDQPTCIAGTGGDVTLVMVLKHHGQPILSHKNYLDSVYIKYNASETPSTYDAFAIGKLKTDTVSIPNMKCGSYYVFGSGFDTTRVNQRVVGGLGIKVTQSSGVFLDSIPVSEAY